MNQDPTRQHPLRIYLRVNNRCRFKCNHCQGESNVGVCTDYVLDDILDALVPFEPLQIMWCGGEPLLSPRLAEYVAMTADLGACNTVCTTMIPCDSLGALSGRFIYRVEIHGIDSMDFKQHTGWDLFYDFQRHFHGLFDCGHLVEASTAIKVDWRDYLTLRIRWLNDYPIRHLQLFDDGASGPSAFGHRSIQEPELAEMKQYIAEATPKFPVVFSPADKKNAARSLYISPVTEGSAFCEINGVKVEGRESFNRMLQGWDDGQ